jgi:hypothetical protein
LFLLPLALFSEVEFVVLAEEAFAEEGVGPVRVKPRLR